MSELVSNGVQIYQFPIDDETVANSSTAMNGHLPFAVVRSTEEVNIGNKMLKARQYPWGVVQVENENHCDFVKLREMLICVNTEDLREQTHTFKSSADVRGEAAGVCGRATETRGGDATDVCAESQRERVRAEGRRERAAGEVQAAEATACGGEEQAGGEAPESGGGDEHLQQAQSCQRAPAGAGLQHELQQQEGQRAQELWIHVTARQRLNISRTVMFMRSSY